MKRQGWLTAFLLMTLLLYGCARQKVEPLSTESTATERVQEPASPEPSEMGQPDQPTLTASDVILMDGELVSVYPPLDLAFPGNAGGKLVALHARLGQRVTRGDLLAALDDSELGKAVAEAQLALDRSIEDREKGEADMEKTYQRELADAQRQYDRAVHEAERAYAREQDEARRTLEQARRDLERLQMQPPTTSLAEAEVELARAIDHEAAASDAYKQALDRPWEDQDIRDRLYKDWQASIVDRELAELRLDDAQTAMQVHELDLQARRKDIENALIDLERVEKDTVDKDLVEREIDLSLARAVEDARNELDKAQQDLDNAQLYAPWDGVVSSIEASVGSSISGGSTVITLLDTEDLHFVTQNLSERHIAQLRRGQRAEIVLRAFPDVVLTGKVDVVLPSNERTTETDARFKAYIQLDETDLDLLPGMTGRVEVSTGK